MSSKNYLERARPERKSNRMNFELTDPGSLLPTFHTLAAMHEALAHAHCSGENVALVPTMGALHAGHLALVRHAAALAPHVVVSIFVNPLQFGPNEDFRRYPRALANDVAAAKAAGATHIFAPEPEEFTPLGLQIAVDPGPMADVLEGAHRPGHFRGVCTIVLKLFNVVQPNFAVFGWKDAQQFIILRKMVHDLNVPVEMVALETVREVDGLAMSSRNAYLSVKERLIAPELHRALQAAQQAFATPGATLEAVEEKAEQTLVKAGFAVDYVRVVDSRNFARPDAGQASGLMIAAAAKIGQTRLIDNVRW